MAEELALRQRIDEILAGCGYSGIANSEFEKITGALVWCIANGNADVSYKIFTRGDEPALAARIQIAESIESALRSMRCPFPLQAHQIQGLDYAGVLPVLQWLSKRVMANRDEEEEVFKAEDFRRRSHQAHPLEVHEQASDPVLHSSHGADTCSEQIIALQLQVEQHKKKLSLMKDHQKELSSSEKRTAIHEKVERQKYLQSTMGALVANAGNSESRNQLDALILKLKQSKALNNENAAVFESFLSRKHAFQDKDTVSQQEEPDLNHLREELAKVSRAVASLQRRLDDLPVQSELIQYERYFMELYVNIQAKLRETRKYFASYNALVEVNELSMKEVSLLNSIHSQYEMAMATPEGRAKFVDSVNSISTGVQQRLKKMEGRVAEKKASYDVLKEKHGSALASRRHYFALLKQLQEELGKL